MWSLKALHHGLLRVPGRSLGDDDLLNCRAYLGIYLIIGKKRAEKEPQPPKKDPCPQPWKARKSFENQQSVSHEIFLLRSFSIFRSIALSTLSEITASGFGGFFPECRSDRVAFCTDPEPGQEKPAAKRISLAYLPMKLNHLITLCAAASLPSNAFALLDFNRDIRPILSDNCFACHGFDAHTRKADLRLDTPEGAYAVVDGVQAVKPGSPEKSSIIERIESKDEDEVMPPPESHKKLTAQQVETLKQWIKEGAVYQQHWAFEPPQKVAGLPGGDAAAIDHLLEATLKKRGLSMSPEASPEQLIRRATLDLTGLPPTLEQVDRFLEDCRQSTMAAAYERAVDRLLQSPHYGEHMARYWLDAARYGDTHGLHLDNERSMWPYRDWVVNAFNENLPFDQFTVQQLAGDLLPNPTREQLVATGFNRCNVTTSEGGSINEEWIYRYAVDRTDTTVSVWMALTAGCAVCHDHKYDPLSQKEFFSLYAFFNSTADPAMDGNILLTQPILRLTTAEQEAQLAKSEAEIKAKQEEIRSAIAQLDYVDPATLKPVPPVQTSEVVWFDDSFPAGAKVSSDGEPLVLVSQTSGPVASGEKALKRKATGVAQDYYSSGAKSFEVPANGKLAVSCYIEPDDKPRSIMVQFHVGGWNHRAVWGDEGAIPFGKVRTTERQLMGALPEAGKWVKLEFNADRVGLKPGMKVSGYAFTQFGGTVHWDRLVMSSRVDPARDPQWSWSKWVERNQGRRVEGLPQDLQTLVRGTKAAEWSPADTARVKAWWFENEYQGARHIVEGARAQKLALEAKKKTLEEAIPATFIMKDLDERRDAFVMLRGQYDQPGEKVSRGVPAVLPPLPKKTDYNRLDLARWLVAPEHPLTARVQVNKLWQQVFGTGLVKTSNDFGSQGEPPSHPELLDWLAVTFREQGWDMKRMMKMLLMTKAYRQSSSVSPELLASDPENRLLARGPRHRLDAEVIRDQALAVSGLLIPKLGGKGVKPYQPENIWEPVAYSGSNTRFYIQDKGESLYRRSLYTFIKRTAPAPAMTNFDGPSREAACLRRERSNTPMQALQLMNDIQHMEAARNFAQRILAQGGSSTDARISFAWRSATARRPTAEEASIVERTLQEHHARYRADTGSAKKLITFGESASRTDLDPAELAAWTLIANLLLNLDEALNR